MRLKSLPPLLLKGFKSLPPLLLKEFKSLPPLLLKGGIKGGLVGLSAGFLVGCAPSPPFVPFPADTPVAALGELTSRRERIRSFNAKVHYNLSTPSGGLDLKGSIQFISDNRWNIKFIGPMGFELAEIIVAQGRYSLITTQGGRSESGPLSDPLEIPELQLTLPNANVIGEALFPITDICGADNWNINLASLEQDSTLWLYRTSRRGEEEIRLKLTYAPLRVYQEERYLSGETVYTRWFGYNQGELLPVSLKVDMGSVKLAVSFESLHIKVRKRPLTAILEGGGENAGS